MASVRLRSGQALKSGLPMLVVPESEIDTSDIPEWTEEDFRRAVRGRDVMKFWRPLKQAVSPRLDADVIAWLKKDGQGYQAGLGVGANQLLREQRLKDVER